MPPKTIFSNASGGGLVLNGVVPTNVLKMLNDNAWRHTILDLTPLEIPSLPSTPNVPLVSGIHNFLKHSNQKIFNQVQSGDRAYENGGRCYYCRCDFAHQGMGIPINMRKDGSHIYVDSIDVLCSFECALAHIIAVAHQPESIYSKLTSMSQTLLHTLYRMQYPGEPDLEPALDFRLLAINGGDMTVEEYFAKGRKRFRPSASIIINPARVRYEPMSM